MKLNNFILYLLLLYNSHCFSQNLVRNPSFEEIYDCSDPFKSMSFDTSGYNNNYGFTKYWVSPTLSTSDWFAPCIPNGFSNNAPHCWGNDYQQAYTGVAFSGIALYTHQNTPEYMNIIYREYLQTRLSKKLEKGSGYCAKFYISAGVLPDIGNTSILLSDDIDIAFTKNRITNYRYDFFTSVDPNQNYLIPATDYIEIGKNTWATDTSKWYKIEKTFIAKGGEEWLTIGNFKDDAHTNLKPLFANNTTLSQAYIYIDDVSVTELPAPLNGSRDTSLCAAALPLALSANTGFDSYLWSTGDTAQSVSITQAGKYWVRGSVGDCGTVTDTITVQLAVPPVLRVSDTFICSTRLPVTCRADGDYRQFVWSNGDTTRTTRIAAAGSYTVTATWACGQSTARLTVQTVAPLPHIALGRDTVSCLRGRFVPVVLSAPQGLPNYVWSTGETTRNIVARSPQVYSVASENLCGAVEGSIDIQGCAPVVYIPNAFSPNDDGNNDVFAVYTTDAVVRIRSMQIFDRWGQLVFMGENFAPTLGGSNSSIKQSGWDGTFRGQPAAQDVYVYLIDAEFADGTVQQYKGDVTLLR